MKIIAFITSTHLAKQIFTRLKLPTHPFDPEPFKESEWENESQLIPDTPDGFYSDYDPIPEYEVCDLTAGTKDGFAEHYDLPYWDTS